MIKPPPGEPAHDLFVSREQRVTLGLSRDEVGCISNDLLFNSFEEEFWNLISIDGHFGAGYRLLLDLIV